VPNVGHGLGNGVEAMTTLSSFFGNTLSKTPYPVCSWTTSTTSTGLEVNLKATASKLVDVEVWSAVSPDMDFRNDKWESKTLGVSNKASFSVNEPFPSSGYRAFYVNLKYKDAKGLVYSESTRVFLMDHKDLL
jgi:PhoPQ-activated pathogenicity-related protein